MLELTEAVFGNDSESDLSKREIILVNDEKVLLTIQRGVPRNLFQERFAYSLCATNKGAYLQPEIKN